ncbi:hypothetical protein SAMN02800694_1458 [Luteibacter sp. UNCMF331Sha3.1]|uniref:hypothetical protein n=1 Tax=Luteibacter sp. UNCMF331Sha3.1 TaxID=1502760 RepID=UPI0008B65398|nr:hypothetical protein [Luteibacter sp. UNCMF331Sha3.1]SEM54560.1 hypothetical protein SAMN02800694_1458 [Luteibacter sp. UNCMF331Sha3.1]
MTYEAHAHLASDLRGPDSPTGWFRFDDTEWRIADRPPARHPKALTFDWDIAVTADGSLLDPLYAALLYHLKMLIWTMIYDPRGGKPIAGTALGGMMGMIESGARWMVAEGMTDFTQMDDEASERFLIHFLETHETHFGERTRPRQITYASACRRLAFVRYVFRQRAALQAYGILVPASAPFRGEGIESVVKHRLDLHRGEKLQPLSDEVALLLMTNAFTWITDRADDIIRLQESICGDAPDPCASQYAISRFYERSREAIDDFAFTTDERTGRPWFDGAAYVRAYRDGRTFNIEGRQIVRRLVTSLQAACVITLQSCAGLRAAELDGLRDTAGPDTDLPSCVHIRTSRDGMMEHFYVRSAELKVHKREAEWLVGSRIAGGPELPPPVRALAVLHRLYARWRDLAGSPNLILTFSSARGFPRVSESIGFATADYLSNLQKQFLVDHCDVNQLDSADIARFHENDELRGHLWRTTFATFVYRIDHRLIEAISRHYKHMQVAMTERRYIGNDASLVSSLDAASVQSTARFFREVTNGEIAVAGPLVREILEFPIAEGDEEDFEVAVVNEDIRLIDLEYGHCGISLNPRKSRCNTMAQTQSWAKRSPNMAFQSPSTCSGCPLFVASTRHLPYWEKRLNMLQTSAAEYVAAGERSPTVLRKRLAIAKRMVRSLGNKAK